MKLGETAMSKSEEIKKTEFLEGLRKKDAQRILEETARKQLVEEGEKLVLCGTDEDLRRQEALIAGRVEELQKQSLS